MAFGADVDYAQLIKVYGHDSATDAERRYSPPECKSAVVKVIQGIRIRITSRRATSSVGT